MLSDVFSLFKKNSKRNQIVENISDEEWFDHVKKSYPQGSKAPVRLPAFPEKQLQINTVGDYGIGALEQAFEFYASLKKTIDREDYRLTPDSQILDFGCGWGRITRFFIKDVANENIHGVDVVKDFVVSNKKLFKYCEFEQIDPKPPITFFKDKKFKLIVAYSVFSHLSEEMFLNWMKEFYDLLETKGVVAFTTRHRNFFDYCKALSLEENLDQSLKQYQKSLSKMFEDFSQAQDQYDRGEFVFSSAKGVTGGDAVDYGEAFIPSAYAEQTARQIGFDAVEVLPPHGRVDQQTYFFFKD